jgi:membrane associated rhomboid family serine protease
MNANTPGSIVILLATVLVSLLGLSKLPQLVQWSLFRPFYVVPKRQYYTFVSSGFVHASGAHLFFNMLTFYFFGPSLEKAMGTGRFVALYFIALIASELRTYFQQRDNPRYASLGASGAVSAVLFAAIVYFPNTSLFILPIPIPIPAPLFALGYLAYSWYMARSSEDGINHSAHIDGAVTGLLFVAATDMEAYRQLARLLV